jgi:hypothetical protein
MAAAFLKCDYKRLVVGAQSAGTGVSVVVPDAPVADAKWTLLKVEHPLTQEQALKLLQSAFGADHGGSGDKDRRRGIVRRHRG